MLGNSVKCNKKNPINKSSGHDSIYHNIQQIVCVFSNIAHL